MTSRSAFLRADASTAVGTGHVVRCVTLAAGLRSRGWTVTFGSRSIPGSLARTILSHGIRLEPIPEALAIDDEPGYIHDAVGPVDLAVVDHYEIGERWQVKARDWASLLMAIDDLGDRRQVVDLLLNQNLGASPERYRPLVPPLAMLLLGPRYALVRPEFARIRAQGLRERRQVGRCLVFISGADEHQITLMAGRAAVAARIEQVDVVVGDAYPELDRLSSWAARHQTVVLHVSTPDMARLMAAADVAVGAPSSASWERCTLGLPSILITVAANQIEAGGLLVEAGAACGLGWYENVAEADIVSALADLEADPERLGRLSVAASTITDGLGADRVIDEIERLIAGAPRGNHVKEQV